MANVDGRDKNKSKEEKRNEITANYSTSQGNQGHVKEYRNPIVKYKKRKGTSGAKGQLYEISLLSLVFLRCRADDEVEDFLLGSNVDGVGDLDDICLRFTYNSKQVAAFIQSKHKDDASKGIADSSLYSPKSKVNLLKCFDSYLQVLNKFETDNSHIFKGDFKDLTFHFVVYTSAVNKISKEKIKQIDLENNDTFNKVKQIISCKDDDPTSADIFQIAYDDQDVDLLSNVLIDKEIDLIAKCLVSVIGKKERNNYDIVKKYADILVPDVITLTENDDYYDGSLNPKLYYAVDEILIKLKYKIYKEILSIAQVDAQYLLTNLQLLFSSDDEFSQRIYLSKLIYRYIVFDERSNQLTFNTKVNENVVKEYNKRLEQLQFSNVLVYEAFEIAGRELLNTAQFKLPKNLIDINEIEECNDKKSLFTNEMNTAKDFLSTLYLYTNQGQVKHVAEKLVLEIAQYHNKFKNSTYKARTRADVASLKFQDKIKEWWLLDGKSYFLTKTCDYLEKLAFEIAQPFIDMLSLNYQHEIDQYHVQFQHQKINYLDQINNNRITNIITCSLLLTTLKLKQFFCGVCVFIDYKYLNNLHENEWELLKEELKNKTNTILILQVCDKFQECERGIANIVDAFEGKIVIVSNETFSKMNNNRVEINHTIVDETNTLSDMATKTQNKLLGYEVDFQGHKVTFSDLINTDYSMMNSEIVLKILKNETITIGHSLSNSNYEDIEDFYMPRTFVSRFSENKVTYDDYYDVVNATYYEYKLDTFEDMPRNINIITAEAGIGKSTILTHLSLETKKEYPQKWIIRMNLLDYCDEFEKLGTEVKQIEFMKLIIMSEFEDISKFSIKNIGGNVTVEYIGNDPGEAFALKIMMKCYSKGDIIFIFDGFDEICPDYQTQVTNFIKNIDYDRLIEGDRYKSSLHLTELFYPSETTCFQIWITSRPYDFILQHLEKEFGASLILKPLKNREIDIFYDKYWNVNFKTQEVNMIQLNNIQTFFNFMGKFLKKLVKSKPLLATNVPLYQLYISAVRYFRKKTQYMPLKIDKEIIIDRWVSDRSLKMITTQTRCCLYTAAEDIVAVPLYMDMVASYFVAKIKSDSLKPQTDWDLGYTTLNYYKRFVELKLKVQFQDKNGMKISRPDVKSRYNDEHARFVSIHKKLAFYSIFRHTKYLKKLLTKQDRQDIEITMQKIKDGKEKSGLIERIHNKVPIFIHLTFAEFFAVEFIVDIILSKPQLINTTMDLMINFVTRPSSIVLMTMFNQRLKYDGTKLKEVLGQDCVRKVVAKLIWNQQYYTDLLRSVIYCKERNNNVSYALDRLVNNKLSNVAMFLLRNIDGNLTEDNIEMYIEAILGTVFFFGKTMAQYPSDSVDKVLNKIRKVDVVFIKKIVDFCYLYGFKKSKVTNITNKEIMDVFRCFFEYVHIARSYVKNIVN